MTRAIFRTTSVVGALTLLSRITGLLRDMVYARMLPTGTGVMDAFLVAYQIPNTLRRLFAEGAFSQAFVPVVAEYRSRRSQDDVRQLVDSTAGTLGLVVFVVSLLGVLAAPVLILFLGPGFKERGTFDLAVEMLRWTFPYLFFVSLTALAGGVLNSYGKFAIPALTSVALNLTAIVFAAWIAPHTASPGVTLAIGVFVAGIIQLSIQVPPLLKLRLLRRPRWDPRHEGVRRIGKLMIPAIIGSSMGQISVLISSSIATLLATGSVAWLYYADRLVEFPLGVFSIALATVILPSLSAHHADAAPERFAATLDRALRLLLVIVVPAAVALAVLAGPLTVVIFHYGQFTENDVYMTEMALVAYSFALLGWSLVKVLAPGFFARQDTKTPMRSALQSLGVTIGLNLIFLTVAWKLDLLDRPGFHIVLAATNGVGAMVNAWTLYSGLRRQKVLVPSPGWPALLGRILVANGVMAAVLWWVAGDLRAWLDAGTLERIGRCASCVGAGMGAYFAMLWALGARPRDFATRGG
jgi:putative peptidoglycan lipid II flippase